MIRVVNASPLIVLSHLARLDLLSEPRPGVDVVVPRAVLDEVMRGEADDPAVSQVPLAIGDWLGVIPTPTVHASIRAGPLDPGDVAVLSAALDYPGWEAVLDVHAARREAARLGIPCIGTVGLVLAGNGPRDHSICTRCSSIVSALRTPPPAQSGEPIRPLDELFAMAHRANGSAGKIGS